MIDLDDVTAAAARIDGVAHRTPVLTSSNRAVRVRWRPCSLDASPAIASA